MKKLVYAMVWGALMSAGCEKTVQAPAAPATPEPTAEVAQPAEPPKAKPAAPAAPAPQLTELKTLVDPLTKDVPVTFKHHTVLDLSRKGKPDSADRNIILETIELPLKEAMDQLGAQLAKDGFEEKERREVNDQILLGYTKPLDATTITMIGLRGRPYAAGQRGKAAGSTGTLSISVRHVPLDRLKQPKKLEQ